MDYSLFDEEYEARIDYLTWFQRIVSWDALLPLFISVASLAIARLLKHQPPADIVALVGLPVVAFVVRLVAGHRQIRSNTCGELIRGLQFAALLFALSALVVVDFFVALIAFVPGGNGPLPNEIQVIWSTALLVYFVSVTIAMYPGRRRKRCR